MQDEDEQHRQAFGEHTGLGEHTRRMIDQVKNNACSITIWDLGYGLGHMSNLAWRLLGRYIARNTVLQHITLDKSNLTDEKMSLLFRELVSSSSMKRLDLENNQIGIDGVQSMIPFLENAPQLIIISIKGNNSINTECFEILVSTLHNRGIKRLIFGGSNITNISALDTYNLPNLDILCLSKNNIGREGCIIISNQIRKEGSTLRGVYLNRTGMGDEEAELLATSLKHNNKLELITLAHNDGITQRGHITFLKLLIDVSSIESTYHSNSTLTTCIFSSYSSYSEVRRGEKTEVLKLIEAACKDNRSTDPGRAKVIRSHLNSQTLKKLCQLQGMEYIPGNLFADIEPVLLPQILALISSKHGQSELYTTLIQTAPNLLSYR